MSREEFDRFAAIYDIWAEGAACTEQNLSFYVGEYLAEPGQVAELGVGNGRIALEAARRGKELVGVDLSPVMLETCRFRAKAEGLESRLTLLEGDIRDFRLPRQAALITIPFHTINHLPTLGDKARAFAHIRSQLRPGGRLIFDTFIFRPEIARKFTAPSLREEFRDEESGEDCLLWSVTSHDTETQRMRIIAWVDRLKENAELKSRQYVRLDFSWIDPDQVRDLLVGAGYEALEVFGDFDRSPMTEDSPEQIWVVHRAG